MGLEFTKLGFVSMITRDLDGTAENFVKNFNGVRHDWGKHVVRPDGWTGCTVYIAGLPLQIMTPTEKGSVLDQQLDKRGESVYAIRFDVPDLAKAKDQAEAEGLRVVGYMEGNEFFIHPKDTHGVFFEIGQM